MANIISISEVSNPDTLKEYLSYISADLQSHELEGISLLRNELQSVGSPNYIFDGYLIGYKIAQISKEFDLLRIGSNLVINIEIKRQYNHESILKQLRRNKYYLKFLNRSIKLFTFISDSKKLYQLSDTGENINEVLNVDLVSALIQQNDVNLEKADSLFNPSNYLVSPFNSTERFISNEYFLTNQQENIKNDTLMSFSTSSDKIIAIEGRPGTGKTLLLYDIARTLSGMGKKVLIIHVGKLNKGHIALRDVHSFNIISVKSVMATLRNLSESTYKCIIVDEAQRINKEQISEVLSAAQRLNINMIIGFDSRQVLHRSERLSTSLKLIEEKTTSRYTLTDKIRTNQSVSLFIQALFDLKRKKNIRINNVSVVYFSNYAQAQEYINTRSEYSLLNYTPSTFAHNKNTIDDMELLESNIGNAHEVIGQEFDNVIAVIDEVFYYNSDGLLNSKDRPGVPYDQLRMLFQIVTRTRNKLELVVVNNESVFKNILKIINGS
ncbi:MAG TPA: DNA/RNA helicase domain-containing protein [Candidatus Saccharimonadales bacterium]|jgi:Cdc6-like AAA superfamily ATPase|nr:DNA/RNA helicase domain-containing protein [Candidatus Saccharimonadales bacterium]